MTSLVEKYKPKHLDEFIGMDRARAVLSNFASKPYSSAWLLLGDSGLGKTTMAMALADAIRAQVHHVPSRQCDLETVDKVCYDCHLRPMFTDSPWHVVLVDECDVMTHAAQLAFLSKLDGTQTPPDTIFLFTANSTALLKDRFLSRCRVVRFDTSDLHEPLVQFLQSIFLDEAPPNRTEPDYDQIIRESKLNVRTALMLLEQELLAPAAIKAPPRPARASGTRAVPLPASTGLIDSYALAAQLGIDRSTLYTRVKRGQLPPPMANTRPMAWDPSALAARGVGG